jgi:hypothetical protein
VILVSSCQARPAAGSADRHENGSVQRGLAIWENQANGLNRSRHGPPGVFCAYAAVAIVSGLIAFLRRDA